MKRTRKKVVSEKGVARRKDKEGVIAGRPLERENMTKNIRDGIIATDLAKWLIQIGRCRRES
ncbi:hypothetical protein [Treponema sp. R6D11]